MKSVLLFNIAVLFLCVGTALSVAVYSEDYGRNKIIGYEQTHLTTPPALEEARPAEVEKLTPLSQNNLGSPLRQLFSSENGQPQLTATTFPQNRIFQPMALFLFGAGLIGIATFTRRKFNF